MVKTLTTVTLICALTGIYLLVFPAPRRSQHRERMFRKSWNRKRLAFADLAGAAGVSLKLEQFLVLSLLAGVGTGVAVQVLTGLTVVAVSSGLLLTYLPYAALRAKLQSLQSQRGKAWPNLVDNLVSGVRAGLSLGETLLEVAGSAPKSLQRPFSRFAADYRAGGNLDASLKNLKHDLADPVGDRIVEALRLASQVGGNDLVSLLEDLGAMLRAEERTRAEVLARQSWTVTGARLAVASPWIILALLLTRPGTLAVYSTPTGSMVLLVGALISVAAYILMLRLGRLEVSPRTMRE